MVRSVLYVVTHPFLFSPGSPVSVCQQRDIKCISPVWHLLWENHALLWVWLYVALSRSPVKLKSLFLQPLTLAFLVYSEVPSARESNVSQQNKSNSGANCLSGPESPRRDSSCSLQKNWSIDCFSTCRTEEEMEVFILFYHNCRNEQKRACEDLVINVIQIPLTFLLACDLTFFEKGNREKLKQAIPYRQDFCKLYNSHWILTE